MKLTLQIPKKSLRKDFLKYRPLKSEIDTFKINLSKLLDKINEIEREENQKNHIRDFLLNTYYKDNYEVNTKDVKDLVIHTGKNNNSSVGVIIEAKRPGNKSEMISAGKLNCKAFQELVLYYLHERIDEKNIDMKYCIVTNIYEWFIFDASYFEKYFYSDKKFVKQYEEWRKGQKVTGDTNLFYNEIAKPFIDNSDVEIPAAFFDLRDYVIDPDKSNEEKDKKLITLFKLLSPVHLLRLSIADDSNKLDEKFYKELLHIIGLEEVKEGSKHIIRRKEPDNRDSGSLIENAISKLSILDSSDRVSDSVNYGDTSDEKNFNIALELCLTWINRILFLKLLEAQLINYHKYDNSDNYKFLHPEKLQDFDELFSLFHHVLAVPENERDNDVKNKFKFVPYLNSTLFELSQLEKETINISSLNDSLKLEVMKGSILNNAKNTDLTSLEYILKFLEAYDFSSEGMEDVREENRTLINASVLGKVFEKINGYKDGSIFTPGFITMYMCREAIRLSVTQKFKDQYKWNAENFDDIKNYIADKRSRNDIIEFNEVVDSIKICDPAVGSGHFLVSSLNELIAVKSELGIFADEQGSRISDYDISIEQDELIITDSRGDIFQYEVLSDPSAGGFKVRPESQRLQRTLFHEKQKLIENCLFGVDINPNSVKICMLRLWIELLKNAYYKPPPVPLLRKEGVISTELETLPNIDINIKTGNSLISRFPLDANLSKFGKKEKNIIEQYRESVRDYKSERNRNKKKEIEQIIRNLKNEIKTDISKKDTKLLKLNNIKSELDNLENQTGLFEQTKKEQKEQSVKKKKLKAELTKLTKEVEDIRSNTIYRNAFEWRFEFPEVLNDDGEYVGFDVVIGNPPYIRQESIKMYKENLKKSFDSFNSIADIYIYFIELGNRILKQNSWLVFILPNKFMKAKYGKEIRRYILNNFHMNTIYNFDDFQVFDESTTYPMILIFKKNNIISKDYSNNLLKYSQLQKSISFVDKNIISSFEKTVININQNDINETEWNFNSNINSTLIEKISNNCIQLKYYVDNKIFRGLSSGCNDAFFIDEDIRNELISKNIESKENIFKVVLGKEVKRYNLSFVNKYVLFIPWDFDIDSNIAIKNYLMKFKDVLSKRPEVIEGRFNWWCLSRYGSKNSKYLNFPKIIYPRINNVCNFYLDEEGDYYLSDNNFFISSDSKYLLAILNSKLTYFFLKSISSTLSGGYFDFRRPYIEKIPIKDIPSSDQLPFIKLVNEISDIKKQGKDTTSFEDQIDRMVYELYGLTEEEIGVVEGK